MIESEAEKNREILREKQTQEIQELMNKASDAARAGNTGEAMMLYEQAASIYMDMGDYENRQRVYQLIDDLEREEAQRKEAERIAEQNDKIDELTGRARAAERAGNIAEAIGYYEEISDLYTSMNVYDERLRINNQKITELERVLNAED
jgi:tetratricopeptide (TPR) repeat protein